MMMYMYVALPSVWPMHLHLCTVYVRDNRFSIQVAENNAQRGGNVFIAPHGASYSIPLLSILYRC